MNKKIEEVFQLINEGLLVINQQKEKEFTLYKLLKRIEGLFRKNPVLSEGWYWKGMGLRDKGKHDGEDIYCFEMAILINPLVYSYWIELSKATNFFLKKEYKIRAKLYHKIGIALKGLNNEELMVLAKKFNLVSLKDLAKL